MMSDSLVRRCGVATAALLAMHIPHVAEATPRDRLLAGELLVSQRSIPGAETPAITVRAVVDASAAQVWQVIEDCGAYARTFDVKASRFVKRSGQTWTCAMTVNMPIPFSDLHAVTRAVHTRDGEQYQRTWHMIEGNYRHNEGTWIVRPFEADPSRTLVVYDAHVAPDTSVPQWAQRIARKRIPSRLIEGLRREVRTRFN